MTAGFIPGNLQRSAREIQAGAALRQAETMGDHQGGAGAGATGQGRASTPLPHPHHQMGGAEGLHEVHVGAGGKGRMHLQGGPVTLEIDSRNIVHGNHHMGIAHASRSHREGLTSNLQAALGDAGLPKRQGGWDGSRLEERGAHVNADGAIGAELGNDATGQGFDLPLPAWGIPVAVSQEASQAADAIAAHLRLTAIGIENTHPQFSPLSGGQGQDDAVAAHAKAAIAQALNPLRSETEIAVAAAGPPGIEHEEIVSQTLIFAELEHDGGKGSHHQILCRAFSRSARWLSIPPSRAFAICRI